MTKKTLLFVVPIVVAAIVTLVPAERLTTVATAVAAFAAAAIGIVLALQTRPRPTGQVGEGVFDVLQVTPLGDAGRLVAVRFGGRIVLLAANRHGAQRVAEMDDAESGPVEIPRPPLRPARTPQDELREDPADEYVRAFRSLARTSHAESGS